MKKRKINIDNLKGILIFLVVFGHALYSYKYVNNITNLKIVNFIYIFHMPLFMMISGYLTSKNVTKDKIIKLLLLFLFMNFSFTIYDYIYNNEFNFFLINYSSWYVLLMAIYRLIFTVKLKRIIEKHVKISIFITFLLAIIIGFINTNIIILRFFEYLLFYLIGYILSTKNIKYNKYISLIIIFIILIIYLVLSNIPLDLSFYMGYPYNNIIELYIRVFTYLLNIILFILLLNNITNKKVPLLTKFGRNSLYIYAFHRIPTLLFDYYLDKNILFTVLFSLILCIILSFDFIYDSIDKLFNNIVNISIKFYKTAIILFVFLIIIFSIIYFNIGSEKENSALEQEKIDNSISIGFVGDLILLENQVNNSYYDNSYDFDYMFKYMKKYFNETDYTIGVFEGPSNDNKKYSIGNYDDNKELLLNYPSSFIKSIKQSGIDLVTCSNNHLLDSDIDSVGETIKNLDKYDLDHVGIYNNKKEYKIINVKGIKIGVLSYTYGINYHNNHEYPNITNYLANPNDKNFYSVKQSVENDFKNIKNKDVDLIMVLPHYGTEFNYDFDSYQNTWNKIFLDNGADIILGDHSHVIGKVKQENDKYVLSSPGNYVNSYIGHKSDLSMYVKVYIDKKTKKVISSSYIPMLAVKKDKGYYPVPLYKLKEEKVNSKKIKDRLELFGKTLFNNKNIKLHDEYYYDNKNYKIKNKFSLKKKIEDTESLVYEQIENSSKVCFIGDSITDGAFNGNKPWYVELMKNFNNKEVVNISHHSYTTIDAIKHFSVRIKNSGCDLFIINIGTNDIRYNELNENEYLKNMIKIMDNMSDNEIILLSPWRTYSKDEKMSYNRKNKEKLYDKYDKVLEEYSKKYQNIIFINTNKYINSAIKYNGEDTYILDGVHPNGDIGVRLYSFSVLR